MTTRTEALRTAITVLTAQLALEEGKPATAYLPVFDTDEAERKRLAEIAERTKPHAWRDAGPGTPITMVGDNDDSPELDELLRAFRPFCDALTRERQPDSTGALFFVPHIKRRGGTGMQSVRLVRDEIRGAWYSAWGEAWRKHPLNATLLPKPEVVEALFAKVYG